MIKADELLAIGQFNAPHGINGEISATLQREVDIKSLKCVIIDIDGIFVPFFIDGIRGKGSSTLLLTIDGIDSQAQASELTNKTIYALVADLKAVQNEVEADDYDSEELYAEQLIGFKATDTSGRLDGEISAIDDATENVLFVIEQTDGGTDILIPVVDDFIAEIDPENRTILFDLPDEFPGLES